MGKKPAARQPSPMWVTTADLPTSAGHPFFERLNQVLEEAGFDAFVEGLCAVFYASRLGRPSLRPGRYFRLLFIGYFEGLSSERGIAWRVADSLSLRAFLDLDVTEAPPNHSTLSRTRRLIDVETHVAVFTWVLERLAGAGLVQGKTVGVDATTLEANAAMRSIERRPGNLTRRSCVSWRRHRGETPTRAELARFDRSRKDRKTSNKAWQSPQDRDAKIAKMKDGRTHLAHKAEHGVDLETGAILSVTVQDASEGDSATLPETLTMAAEQVEAVRPDGAEVEEVVADNSTTATRRWWLCEIGVRSYVSEPERGPLLAGQEDGRDAGGEACCAEGTIWEPSAYSRRPRSSSSTPPRGAGGAAFRAPVRDRGAAAGVGARPRECAQAGAHPGGGCNLGQLLRRLTGVGTPRSLQGRALSAICGLIGPLTALWGRLTASWDFQWTPAGLVGQSLIAKLPEQVGSPNRLLPGLLERFMEFVRSNPDARAAERLLALKRLGLPEFGQMSFATKILMFLDPDRYPVLDLKIARATAKRSYFEPLQKLTVNKTSIPITRANADAYARWACWCRSIATQINAIPQSPCGYLRAVDVERAVFQLVDSEEMDKVRTLLEGPLDE